MNIFKTSSISAVTNIISIIVKLLVNKIAAFIGPANFAIYGQFKDLIALTTTISQLGTENGIIKYTTETYNDKATFKKFINTAIIIHLASGIITTLIVITFKKHISLLLFKNTEYTSLLAITICSLTFAAFYNFLLNILNGLKQLKLFTIITIVSTIVSGIISIALVSLYNINGLIASIAVNNIIFFCIAIYYFKKKKLINVASFKFNLDKLYLKKLLGFSLMAISGMVSLTLSLLFIRTTIIDKIGDFEAGIWDSLWRISAIYITFLTASFKFYLLPTFTALKNNLLRKEIFKIWKITFPIIIAITACIFLFKDIIIRVLFTPEFLAIKSIILFQLLGDIIRIHSWTIGHVLISKAKTKSFVFIQLLWGITFCSSSYLFINMYGLQGATIGYLFTCIIHFVVLNIAVRKLIWCTPKNLINNS